LTRIRFAVKSIILSPFALIFILISETRNFFFRHGIFKIHKLPVPVISIGNLSMGGTGKTPFVISLIESINSKFNHIVVISRGYGRKSKGAKIVSSKGNIELEVKDAGDEPYLIAQSCPECSVVVAEKRVLGWKLIKGRKPDLVILDDAYQHQYIHRDLNILLENGNHPIDKDHIFPIGKLRELKKNSNRADIVCTTKTSYNEMSESNIFCEMIVTNADELKEKEYNLVSAIANPSEFISACKVNGIKVKRHFVYKDHDDYESVDFSKINNELVLTTEKDYEKLKKKIVNLEVLKIKYKINERIIKTVMEI
jgi:tetraacyldisaccharide 4'-kinase